MNTVWIAAFCMAALAAIAFLAHRSWKRQGMLQRRSEALRALYDIGRTMASTLDFQSLLQQIMDLSRATIGAKTASVMLADDEAGELVLVCSHGLPEDVKPGTRLPNDQGIAGWVYKHGEPVMLHGDRIEDPRFGLQEGRGHIRSALCVPLVGKRGPIGVLSLNNSTRRSVFTQEDLDLLTLVGAQAGIAVENARLHQEIEEANQRLTMTVEHLRNLKSSLTSMTAPGLQDSLETMLDAAVEGTGALAGWLTILDEDDTVHHIVACYDSCGLRVREGAEGEAERGADFVVPVSEALQAPVEQPGHSIVRTLTAEEKVTGLLKLIAPPDGPGFNEDDHEFIEALVEHASTVVFNDLLYRQAEAGRRQLEQAYQDLQEKQDRLVQAEKLAAVGRLAAWVCHEINNPLGAISGCAQLMQRKLRTANGDGPGQETCAKYLSTIISETERCARITGDLLQFSRQQEPRLMDADLHAVLTNALTLIQYKYPSGVRITTSLDPAVPRITADPQQLTQVFLNLLTNAVQAMPEGGAIDIRTRYLPHNEHGGLVSIEITDSGPGISDEDAARVFDPFFTTKDTGTGLGLTISKGIVEKHRGVLHLARAGERGTTASISLPVRPSSANPVGTMDG